MGTMTAEDFERLEKEHGKLEDDLVDDDKEEPTSAQPAGLFDGDGIPDELRGKSPEQVLELYRNIKDAGQKMAGLLRSNMAAAPAQRQPEPEPEPKITAADFLDDEGDINEKIGRLFEHKARPYLAQQVKMAADTMYDRQLRTNETLSAYKNDVDNFIVNNQLRPEQVAHPATWAVIEAQVLRDHFDEIAEKRRGKPRPTPPDAIIGDNKGRQTGKTQSKLTPEQREAAKALGVSLKEAELYAGFEES